MPLPALIIFVKNPIEGNVKTRIAKTVGHAKAVEVYQELLLHTRQVVSSAVLSDVKRTVYYGDFVSENDLWNGWEKALQCEGDLGQRMQQAFREQFEAGATKVLIIGSDCLQLHENHIKNALRLLDTQDAVIGPSTDGGYYLLGMKRLHNALFENMPWSQSSLLHQTLTVLETENSTFSLLEPLTDIDEWEDYLNAITLKK
ncbi:TIGR04282 family arsenosugar biosynthesis glycosyltransferase [Arundinibacter roseus]|uniref:Glycosyltransferase n=1 Tax=Arundinibacter roseus TaxID=2070510 RepID=A0A4V2X9T8_9BACT|nr:TIGR04282 family arsenosugar biosynthesis glycosyltransferase [Arundinibacter roseus]TDB65065.1 glycosyltransferase [Arundinibacter roseus]